MRVGRTSRTWEQLASDNPLRAIVDTPDGDSMEAFIASGEQTVSVILDALETIGVQVRRATALDFGCGVGRLTLPLASRFEQVTGVDASPTMIRRARALAADGGAANIEYRASQSASIDLPSGSQDFVLSLITLQHVPARAQARYLAQFARILAPGGIAVVQVITGHADEPTSWLRRRYRQVLPQDLRNRVRRALRPGRALPEIYAISNRQVLDAVSGADVELVVDVEDHAAPGWASRRYVLRRH